MKRSRAEAGEEQLEDGAATNWKCKQNNKFIAAALSEGKLLAPATDSGSHVWQKPARTRTKTQFGIQSPRAPTRTQTRMRNALSCR